MINDKEKFQWGSVVFALALAGWLFVSMGW